MPAHDFVERELGLKSGFVAARMKEWLLWRLNRLGCMTRAEIRHRLLRTMKIRAERWGLLGSDVVPPPDLAQATRLWIHAKARVDAAPYLAAADRLAAGKFDAPVVDHRADELAVALGEEPVEDDVAGN